MAIEATPAQAPDEPNREPERRLELFTQEMFARVPADLVGEFPRIAAATWPKRRWPFSPIARIRPLVHVEASPDAPATAAVQTLMLDRPFIVDSILAYFHKHAIPVRMVLHPVFNAVRDEAGDLLSFEQATAAERAESYTYTWIELVPGKPGIDAIQRGPQRRADRSCARHRRFRRDDRARPDDLRRDLRPPRPGRNSRFPALAGQRRLRLPGLSQL